MPVRIRITLLFSLLVLFILGLVCGSVYYFTYTLRLSTIRIKLTNKASTVGRLLSQTDVFSNELIQRIESSTSISYRNKVIQAYDLKNDKIYSYSTVTGDTLNIDNAILHEARVKGNVFFAIGNKEAVAHYSTDRNHRIIVVAAGEDLDGIQTLETLQNILMLSFSGGFVIALLGGYLFSK